MDDVLVFGKGQAEHDEQLTAVLKRIKSAWATLNPEKCEFGKTKLKFLGHLVDESGIRADRSWLPLAVQVSHRPWEGGVPISGHFH